jgi:WD40 repeat protein
MEKIVIRNGYITKHSCHVRGVQFLQEQGGLVASAGNNGRIKFTNMYTSTVKQMWTLEHESDMYATAYTLDCKSVAAGFKDGKVSVFDLADGSTRCWLAQHTDCVYAVAWSPCLKYLASGSKDKTILIWDVTSGKNEAIACLRGHTGTVKSLGWSPDGRYLASGSFDNHVRLWDAHTWEQAGILTGHTSWVLSVAWRPDSQYVASGSWDNTLRIWNVAERKEETSRVMVHQGHVHPVVFSPDGQRIASASSGNNLHVWDFEKSSEDVDALAGHTAHFKALAWSSDSKLIASGGWDNSVRVWNVSAAKHSASELEHEIKQLFRSDSRDCKSIANNERCTDGLHSTPSDRDTLVVNTAEIKCVTWSEAPGIQYLASGSEDGVLCTWNTFTGKRVLGPLHAHVGTVTSLSWSRDGKRIASGGWDCKVYIWDAETGHRAAGVISGHTGPIRAVAWSPCCTLVACGSDDCLVHILDAASGLEKMDALKGHKSTVTAVAWSRCGEYAATGSKDHSVRIWQVVTGDDHRKHMAAVACLAGHTSEVLSVSWSPDSKHVASGGLDKTVRIWNLADESSVTLGGHSGTVRSVAWSPSGAHVASGSDDMLIHIWDAVSKEVIAPLAGHTGSVMSVAWSPAGDRIGSGSWDKSVRLWDVATRKEAILMGNSFSILSMALSGNGKYLATSSASCRLDIWSLTMDSIDVFVMKETKSNATCLAFNSDGTRLVSCSQEGAVTVWNFLPDSGTLDELWSVSGHDSWVYSAAWSGDDQYVVSGSWDNALRIWEAATGQEYTRHLVNNEALLAGDSEASMQDVVRRVKSASGCEAKVQGYMVCCLKDRISIYVSDGRDKRGGSISQYCAPWHVRCITCVGDTVCAGCEDGQVSAYEGRSFPWFAVFVTKSEFCVVLSQAGMMPSIQTFITWGHDIG